LSLRHAPSAAVATSPRPTKKIALAMLTSPSAADAFGRRELFSAHDLIQNNPAFDILSFGESKNAGAFLCKHADHRGAGII
jgi:hypothetical protein